MSRTTVYEGKVDHLQILDEEGRLDLQQFDGKLADADAKALYERMIIYREFDKAAFKLQRSGRMGTFPQNKGQEAVALGTASALRRGIDYLVPYYREHAAMFLHGLPMAYVLLPWMGDERGNAEPAKLSMNPMCVAIGAQILHAVGIAWAFKLRKEDRATLVYFGDGATSTGDFHAALNLAAVQRVGCVFCCVNNGWAISVPTSKQTATSTFAQKALAYDIPTIRVDGNDVFAVNQATREAVARAREGGGPSMIEAVTYRLGDHTTADDAKRYRCAGEFDAACKRDPVIRTRKYLESKSLWDDKQQSHTEERAKLIVREAIEAAMSIDKPEAQDIFAYTFESLPAELARQMQTLRTDSIGQNPDQVGLQQVHEHAR